MGMTSGKDSSVGEKMATGGKFPHVLVYVVTVVWLVIVAALAFTADVKTAAWVLAVSLVFFALARLVLPTGTIPRIRTKAHDAAVALILAGFLVALAQWGNAPPV